MKSQLNDIPRYSSDKIEIDADTYNCIRIALLRIGKQIRFSLPGLRTLEMCLDEETWICVDHDQNDIPIIAWLNFTTEHRENLHQPIVCEVYYYHTHATTVEERVLNLTVDILDKKMHQK